MKTDWKVSLALAVIVALLMAPMVLADDISNNLDASIDAGAEVMSLNVGGANGTTQLYVTPRNGDGKNGCNLTGSTTLVVSVMSSNTAAATVSPSSITFTSCGDTPTLTITPLTEGSTTITVSETSNTTDGSFNFAPATIVVNVAFSPTPNTAPQISVAGVTEGESYEVGSVPAAMCQVTDLEDGNTSFQAGLSAVTGPYASDGIGAQTATCSYTDSGGLTASASVTYNIADPTAPEIESTLNPASPDGNNGWYKSDVTLTWAVTENESPNSLVKTGCDNQLIVADQVETSYSCEAISAGGSAEPVSVTIKRDATVPTISGAASPAANGAGWNNSDVTVSFSCGDNLSGVASCGPNQTLSSEGAGQSASGTAVDNAGNSASTTVSGISIDKSAPSVSLVGGPADGAFYYFGSVPVAPSCSASDALSGLNGDCNVFGYSAAVGTHTVTATATDMAGNLASASATYTVLSWTLRGFYQPVDMNGVYNVVKGGSTVPLKFEVFAGPTELTNTSVVSSFVQTRIACDGTAPEDDLVLTTTGGTSLRYDSTSGQFIQNWQTPRQPGTCYRVTMTTQDGSSLVAFFKLK